MSDKDTAGTTRTCAKDLQPGDSFLQFFQVRSKEARKTRSGQDYLDLSLGDATGTIPAKMWSDVIRKWGHDFAAGDFVKVEGRVESYKDRPQLVVDKIRKAELSELPDPSALVRISSTDPDACFDELFEIAKNLQPQTLAELVMHLLETHSEAIKTYPAARMIHHAYRGGFVEHVLAVTKKAQAVLELEPSINRSITLAGAILHDIGKIIELAPSGQGRTPEGRLLGHVIQGMNMMREAALEHGLTDEPWLMDVEHILASHHGDPAFGAVVRPLTREALLVHFVDNLDAKLRIMDEALQSADADGFTSYNKWLDGRVYRGSIPADQEESGDGDTRETGRD